MSTALNLYPGAKLIPADPSNYRTCSPKRTSYDLVVLHVTDGHEHAEPVAEMWQEPHHHSSAHFVIGQAGEVIQCVDMGDIAWHASQVNSTSIGIEHCARTPGSLYCYDPGLPVSKAQMAASAKLVAWLLKVAGLPADRDHVKGHYEASPKDDHPDCPTGAPGWDWDAIMARVVDAFESQT